jgi:lipid-A-disaccharide synthase-like uncharacterized protein
MNMDWLHQLLWYHDHLLGIQWTWWKVVGWLGNGLFFSRFLVQWYATEKQKQVVVPVAFWWLSLAGSLVILAYAVFSQRDSVFILSFAFNWIVYIRNLIIHKRHAQAHLICPDCGKACPPESNFCPECGARLVPRGPAAQTVASHSAGTGPAGE